MSSIQDFKQPQATDCITNLCMFLLSAARDLVPIVNGRPLILVYSEKSIDLLKFNIIVNIDVDVLKNCQRFHKFFVQFSVRHIFEKFLKYMP
jgi:hypothetical protein